MKQSVEAVSKNLKDVREQRGLSLDQLSGLTGVSKSMLRQIETGKSSPTIATIWKIANGLRVSFTSLLRQQEIEAEVKHFREMPPLTDTSAGYRVFPLIPFDPHQSFEIYYLEVDPETSFAGEPHKGNIYEYIFVTRGTLEITIEERVFTIKENEFLTFEANHAHVYRCVGEHTATAILHLSYLP